jgi:hypothetical protein
METNYCAHAIDDFRKIIDSTQMPESLKVASMDGISMLRDAQKFRVPDSCLIVDVKEDVNMLEFGRKYACPFGMPYPTTALEFTQTHQRDSATKQYILIIEKQVPKNSARANRYAVVLVRNIDSKLWIMDPQMVLIEEDGGTFYVCSKYVYNAIGGERDPAEESSFVDFCVSRVIMLAAALNCSNVSHSTEFNPSNALNKKRSEAGKQPFFSYHVLDIRGDRRESEVSHNGGTHASPRVHLRRGHIRKHPSAGNIWVNACVVGNKELGMVAKDYRVLPQHETAQ